MSETGVVWGEGLMRLQMLTMKPVYQVKQRQEILTTFSTENILEPPRRLGETEVLALFLFPAPFPLVASSSPEESVESSTSSSTVPSLVKPCDAIFEQLARVEPAQLIRLIRSEQLAGADLASAAEIAGSIADSSTVIPALFPLLHDTLPMVREAAICGLSNHLTDEVRQEIEKLRAEDPSAAVREVAASALDE